MNESNYNSYYGKSVEINLLDMIFCLLKHWRSLIVVALLGTVFGGGIYAVKKVTAPEPVVVQVQEAEQKAEIAKEYQVDPDVKSNMELAYQYRQLYKKQLEYNQKSVIMQLDPNAVYVGELKYYISAGYDTGLVSVLYQNILSDKNLLQELQEASGLECDASYIKELISCAVNKENDSSVSINNVVIKEEDNNVVKNSFVVYTVVSTSEESCEKMLQVIKEKAAVLDQECQNNYDGYSALEVNDAVRLVTNNDYLNKQKANIDQLNTYWANVQKMESTFSDDEQALAYYNKVYLSRAYVTSEEKEEPVSAISETVEEQISINLGEWLVMGFALGVICWGVYYCLRYLSDRTIKTSGEVQFYYNLPVIGCLERKPIQKKGIDGYLERMSRNIKYTLSTEEYVVATINELQVEDILLCGYTDNKEIYDIMENLSRKCRKVQIAQLPGKDSASLKIAVRKAIILIIPLGKMTYKELRRELEVCNLQKISVIGAVVL